MNSELKQHPAVIDAADKAWRLGYNKDFGPDNMRVIIAAACERVCVERDEIIKQLKKYNDELIEDIRTTSEAWEQCYTRAIKEKQAALNPKVKP